MLVWSDIPRNRMMKLENNKVSEFRNPSNFCNGNTIDNNENIISCSHGGRCIYKTDDNLNVTVLVDKFGEKKLNSPNDVCVKSDGTIWFTDPPYGILGDYEGYPNKQEYDGCYVFKYDPSSNNLEVVTTDGAERVNLSGGAIIQGHVTASGGISGSHGHFNEIKQNTTTGLHALALNENLTVSDGENIVLAGAGQENTLTMNESLTIGDGNSGTITYSAGSKTLTVEDSATVDQDLTKDADVQFASATLTGRLTAQEIIVSSFRFIIFSFIF